MVRYMLLDGVSEGRVAEVMGWMLADVSRIYRDLGHYKTTDQRRRHNAANRQRQLIRDRATRALNRAARAEIKQRVLETGR